MKRKSNYTPGEERAMARRRPTLHTFTWIVCRTENAPVNSSKARPPEPHLRRDTEQNKRPGHLRPESLEALGWIPTVFGSRLQTLWNIEPLLAFIRLNSAIFGRKPFTIKDSAQTREKLNVLVWWHWFITSGFIIPIRLICKRCAFEGLKDF